MMNNQENIAKKVISVSKTQCRICALVKLSLASVMAVMLTGCGGKVKYMPKPLDAFSRIAITQAQRQVDDAVELAQQLGHQKVIRLINEEKRFLDGDSYVFILDARKKTIIAHPIFPSLVGKEISSITDASGNSLLALLDATKDGSWVKYEWINPETTKPASKLSWVKLVDSYIYGSGAYQEINADF